MTIGERIRNRRIELQITQDELAQKVGYKSRSSINKIELSRELPADKIALMAKVLQCSPAYLMGWEDTAPDPAPAALKLSEDETELVQGFRCASADSRRAMLTIARSALDSSRRVSSDTQQTPQSA